MGSGDVAPRILRLGARWWWVINFTRATLPSVPIG